jgi:hypothetical protein
MLSANPRGNRTGNFCPPNRELIGRAKQPVKNSKKHIFLPEKNSIKYSPTKPNVILVQDFGFCEAHRLAQRNRPVTAAAHFITRASSTRRDPVADDRIDTFALWGRDQLFIVAAVWDHRLRAHSPNTSRVT